MLINHYFNTIYIGFCSGFWAGISLLYGYIQKNNMKITHFPNRKGCVAIVTGGGRGLGLYVAKGLLKCEMHVIIGVRKPEKCWHLFDEIKGENLLGTIEILELDTSSMKSVKEFARNVKLKYPKVHILVNNAGIIYNEYQLTEDGFESHLATNYLGHFYLTHLLMENLERAGNDSDRYSRIINVSSSAHVASNIIYDDINLKKDYIFALAYSQSKLAQLMFTRYLNRYMESKNLPIRTNACHPGIVHTGMMDASKNYKIFFLYVKLSMPPKVGANAILYPCISEELEGRGGLYLSLCEEGLSTRISRSVKDQDRLFDLTCDMLKIKHFGKESE